MRKNTILFDLDGTLTDPKIGITQSVRHSLKAFGIEVADADELVPFIGPPLRASYKKFYGFSDAEAEAAVAHYREYFADRGIFENAVYAGIDGMLKQLAASDQTLALATSKPTVYAQRILTHFGLNAYFAFVAGSELDGRRSEKAQVIGYALENLDISDVSGVIMVGDRQHDVLGAKVLGMESIGVLYGYGNAEELTNAGATYLADSVAELSQVLANIT